MDFFAVSTFDRSIHRHRSLQSPNRRIALLRHCMTSRNFRVLLLLTTISVHLFTAKVPHESWSISQSSIWWEDVLCDGAVSLMPINPLNITLELLANGTLLFTLVSGTVPFQSGPPLLHGTDPSRTDRLGTVIRLFTLESRSTVVLLS